MEYVRFKDVLLRQFRLHVKNIWMYTMFFTKDYNISICEEGELDRSVILRRFYM